MVRVTLFAFPLWQTTFAGSSEIMHLLSGHAFGATGVACAVLASGH